MITRIKAVYNALGPLAANVVFVDGATLSFYADRDIEASPTDDVDILIELWVRRDFPAIEERLRSLYFKHDMDSKVSCRFYIEGVTLAFHDRIPVDVMTTGEDVLGFSNRCTRKDSLMPSHMPSICSTTSRSYLLLIS